ncbi:hypothetical protein [Streptomyces sp. NPDC050848]|uniref:hypothetical protein n=1 Tax=Streptomyces sp. NPDC050848 TaxID=3155791 RepID=UPI0033C7A7F8
MSARCFADRLAALVNEAEQAGHQVATVGSSIVVDDIKVVMGRFENEPWTVETPTAPDPRFRVRTDAPELYLRRGPGVLHLRDDTMAGLSEYRSRCGMEFDLGTSAILLKVNANSNVCKKCHRTEPSL